MSASPVVSDSGHRLDWIKVQLTRQCNFKCEFCSQADWASPETLDLEAFRTAVLDHLPSLRLLIITGGEPLARYRRLLALARIAFDQRAAIGIFSNLSLLSSARAQELRDVGVSWMRTTLNGANAFIHERSYPAGSFAATMSGVAAAASVAMPVKIRATISQTNHDQIGDLVSFVAALGIGELDFRPYLPLGDCNPHASFALTPTQAIAAAAEILHLKAVWAAKVRLKLLPNWFDFLYRDLADEPLSVCELCHCGRSYLYVDAAGNYRACAGHRAVVGSIFEQGVDEIWRNSSMLGEARAYKQGGYCVSCPQRLACHRSNCHLVNYEAHGRFDDVNPTCPLYALSPTDPVAGYEKVRCLFRAAYRKCQEAGEGR